MAEHASTDTDVSASKMQRTASASPPETRSITNVLPVDGESTGPVNNSYSTSPDPLLPAQNSSLLVDQMPPERRVADAILSGTDSISTHPSTVVSSPLSGTSKDPPGAADVNVAAVSEDAPVVDRDVDDKKNADTATADTANSAAENEATAAPTNTTSCSMSNPVVSNTKKSRPAYKYDASKITLRFLFANRDGLTVTIDCAPTDTVGEVKAALLSVWPDDMPDCDGGERLRLVCMGKGYLMPDARSLEECHVPVFKTHPTPINVSVKPQDAGAEDSKKGKVTKTEGTTATPGGSADAGSTPATNQGCSCAIL